MNVILAILFAALSFVGPMGGPMAPDIEVQINPEAPAPGVDASPGQEWVITGYMWDCKDPDQCPDVEHCPHCEGARQKK